MEVQQGNSQQISGKTIIILLFYIFIIFIVIKILFIRKIKINFK